MTSPDDAILRIAQAMLPLMQQYFEGEEGRLQLSGQTEALEQKEAAPASQPAPPLIFAHYLCVDIKRFYNKCWGQVVSLAPKLYL